MLAAVSSKSFRISSENKLVIILRAVKIINFEPVKCFLAERFVASEAEVNRVKPISKNREIIAAASDGADLWNLCVIGKDGHHSCYSALNKAFKHQIGLINSVLRKRLSNVVDHYCNRTGVLRFF